MKGQTREHLLGLRTQPLASYFAAVGILGTVVEQADPSARGHWHQGHFALDSKMRRDALLDFLLHNYEPTPIASPWNAGSGFHEGDRREATDALRNSSDPRFADYRQTLAAITQTLSDKGLTTRPEPEHKFAFLKALRQNLPTAGRRWIDAVVGLEGPQPEYHRLFFSGGNDGRFEMARVFMERLHTVLLDPTTDSRAVLEDALYDHPNPYPNRVSGGAYHPASVGGLNASSGASDATPRSNPWTYVLSLEGAVRAPVTLRDAMPAGQPSLLPEECERPDLAVPFWTRPLSPDHLAAEPSTHVFSLIPRNGKAIFALPKERVSPQPNHAPLDSLIAQLQAAGRPTHALRKAVHDYQVSGLRDHLLQVLERLGDLRPFDLPHIELGRNWIKASDDGSPEFALALSICGLGRGYDNPLLDIRAQLRFFCGRDLEEKMLSLLKHRMRQAHQVGKRNGDFNAPFWSTRPADSTHIEAFLAGTVDELRLQRLVHALILVPTTVRGLTHQAQPPKAAFLPFPYLAIKPAFHQMRDRRTPPPDIVGFLCEQQTDRAIASAAHFLAGRGLAVSASTGAAHPQSRRIAASLLFAISDLDYQQHLESLGAIPCPIA